MRRLQITSRFKRDIRKLRRRGLDLQPLNDVVQMLLRDEKLPSQYKDHGLAGEYIGVRECHIKPDWILLYMYSGDGLILLLNRTGTDSDILKK